MAQQHETAGRMPERSAAVSGDETKGLTPISANRPAEASPPPDAVAPAPPRPIAPPVVPVGVLQHLTQR